MVVLPHGGFNTLRMVVLHKWASRAGPAAIYAISGCSIDAALPENPALLGKHSCSSLTSASHERFCTLLHCTSCEGLCVVHDCRGCASALAFYLHCRARCPLPPCARTSALYFLLHSEGIPAHTLTVERASLHLISFASIEHPYKLLIHISARAQNLLSCRKSIRAPYFLSSRGRASPVDAARFAQALRHFTYLCAA
jgi:hypothetical protein